MTTTLATLAETAQREGWASAPGSLESIEREARALGWTEVPIRSGQPATTTLRPTPSETAHPHSLSATYGLAAQPLHTDGAHLQTPPDILVLACEAGSSTPTMLWSHLTRRRTVPWDPFHYGMFLVRNGRDSSFTPAMTGWRYRFDLGCMSPCDTRAQEVVTYLQEQLDTAAAHEWPAQPQLLVINNRHCLHARAAVTAGDEQRTLHRIAYRTGQTS